MMVGRKEHQRRQFRSGQKCSACVPKSPVSDSDLDCARLSLQKHNSLIHAFVYIFRFSPQIPESHVNKSNKNLLILLLELQNYKKLVSLFLIFSLKFIRKII